MSGPSTIGFGTLPYRTADGKEREWFAIGLAPRKVALTLAELVALEHDRRPALLTRHPTSSPDEPWGRIGVDDPHRPPDRRLHRRGGRGIRRLPRLGG